MPKILSFLFLFFSLSLQAQFTFVYETETSVKDQGGVDLQMAWAGGINAAQYNTLDLNQDNLPDLVLYDRMAQKLITFLNRGNAYEYAPDYEVFFPSQIRNWVLLRDFNCDGKKDLFTGDNLGMRVYRNVSDDDQLRWELVRFYTGPGNNKSEVLLTEGLSGLVNLQLQFDDMPSIEDIDGDGDLDIINIRFGTSQSSVELNRNFSVENYGTCDSLAFKLVTQTYGDFRECTCGEFAFNGDECFSGGRTEHAGGKSLLAIDVDGNGSKDLLLSEGECNILSMLKNEGSGLSPVFNEALNFPIIDPAEFPIYPSPYFEDVDFDGVKDLIVSPNIVVKESFDINLRSSNWFYKNMGTNAAPDFQLRKTNFLQDAMLDIGDNAVPAFIDMDGDGDLDLFVSNNNLPATIWLYENTGTRQRPAFEFRSDNFNNLSAQQYRNLKIHFVDMNSDGKLDLALTATKGANTNLHYIENKASRSLDIAGQPIVTTTFQMTSLENISFNDIDNDGDVDILKGKNNGAFEYWMNTGNATFTLQNSAYLNLNASVLRTNLASTIADFNGDGLPDLALADYSGNISIVSDFRRVSSADNAVRDVIFNTVTEVYYPPNLGGRIFPVAVDLFNTKRPALVVGTSLGGVRILKPDIEYTPETFVVKAYPNPSERFSTLKVEVNQPSTAQLFSVQGKEVSAVRTLAPNTVNNISLGTLAPAIYILRVRSSKKSISRRIVIQ